MKHFNPSRRQMLSGSLSVFGLMALTPLARSYAVQFMATPPQTRGPFYPAEIPLDSDNDLVTVQGRSGIAKGEISNVVGRVLDSRGQPLKGVRVEIWQCDAHGRYHHPRDRRNVPLDANFQGYGQHITKAGGTYRFRTIKPVPYPGRAPHIHFTVSGPGIEPLTTQMYVAGAPENERDWILQSIRDTQARERLIIPFTPYRDTPGELMAKFDLILVADGRFSKA